MAFRPPCSLLICLRSLRPNASIRRLWLLKCAHDVFPLCSSSTHVPHDSRQKEPQLLATSVHLVKEISVVSSRRRNDGRNRRRDSLCCQKLSQNSVQAAGGQQYNHDTARAFPSTSPSTHLVRLRFRDTDIAGLLVVNQSNLRFADFSPKLRNTQGPTR